MKNRLVKIISLLIIIGLNWTGISAVGETASFFTAEASSSDNSYQAGILDMKLNASSSFVKTTVGGENKLEKAVKVSNEGNIDFRYKITTSNVGDCSGFEMKGKDMESGEIECATSNISNFNCPTTTISNNEDRWNFILDKSNSSATSCDFDINFDAWQTNLPQNSGFSDNGTVSNSITDPVSPASSSVVLNEFLPNPKDFPYEFVELYNKNSDQSYDLSEWHIETNDEVIPINKKTTAQYAASSTVIGPEYWLALTTGGADVLDNASDTITLYNGQEEVVDQVSYPLTDSAQEIEADKSIARNPDGTGGWVDPYPSPGGPFQKEKPTKDDDSDLQNSEEDKEQKTLQEDKEKENKKPQEENKQENDNKTNEKKKENKESRKGKNKKNEVNKDKNNKNNNSQKKTEKKEGKEKQKQEEKESKKEETKTSEEKKDKSKSEKGLTSEKKNQNKTEETKDKKQSKEQQGDKKEETNSKKEKMDSKEDKSGDSGKQNSKKEKNQSEDPKKSEESKKDSNGEDESKNKNKNEETENNSSGSNKKSDSNQ